MSSEAQSNHSPDSLRFAVLLVLGIASLLNVPALAQTPQNDKPLRIIVSPIHPKDSRGEVVYEIQGKDQMDQPPVPGAFINPSPISTPSPKYPKALQKTHSTADVTVTAVITPDGDLIDLTVADSTNPDASSAALDTVRKYRFKPATLDGKPVASLARVVVYFRFR